MTTRTSRAALAALLLTGALAGCSTTAANTQEEPPAQGTVRAALADLPVHKTTAKDGYDRVAKFGTAWSDKTNAPGSNNACDTRNDVLKRDLLDVQFRGTSTCVVSSGTLKKDPYTGKRITFVRGPHTSGSIDVDHAVALSQAWKSGAQQLSQAERAALANDPLNLIAVDGPANRQKGDKDASQWLPPNTEFQCPYVARQVAVKKKYRLWVNPDEKKAMSRVLETCPSQVLPTEDTLGVAIPK
ncbi:HNH endonuclease family protein [Streptomyces sp. NPDC090442]|uniref:HNH endonuclease family protein n=1 Tax=Streptomyces sp. NPDC090442 TaxID=3365962 RepID=UPI00380EE5F4